MALNEECAVVDVSVVIPVFNAEKSLEELTQRLLSVLSREFSSFELIFVDDCSEDGSWKVLLNLREKLGSQIRIVRLAVNSGQHSALLCGLEFSRGAVVVTMDDDLQHAPEDIPALVAAVKRGYDVAIAAYDEKRHTACRNLGGAIIDGLQRAIFGLPRGFQLTSFRAIRRAVVQEITKMEVSFPYLTSMILANASKCTNVPVKHYPRIYGSSNYTLGRSISLALNLIFHYSHYPAYTVGLLCVVALLASAALGLGVVIRTVVFGPSVPGWASTIVAVAFSSTCTQFGLLIVVIYLARILRQLTRARVGFKIAELHADTR
jgi:glycosyltransferase involved in cell wall biosynthesis